MKFVHIADCHIGGWRDTKLNNLSLRAFGEVVKLAISERVGFVLISGDLFDTALPNIDLIKDVAFYLHQLRDEDIPVYIIPGSHDFSPSGKTMLDVLEQAGLLENVMKFDNNKLRFTIDRTGVKITGLLGRKGGLELGEYKKLDNEYLEQEKGFKIFLFHTLLRELRPKEFDMIEGGDLSILPKGFNYYAGGHPHFVYCKEHDGYGTIVYPGPLFPNNFAELERLKYGGFYLVEVVNGKVNARYKQLVFYKVINFSIDLTGLNIEEVEKKIIENISGDFCDAIITLRLYGQLKTGKLHDIDFKKIMGYFKGSIAVMKNIAKLTTSEFQEVEVDTGEISDIEDRILLSHVDQLKPFEFDTKIVNDLINVLDVEKLDGETNADFENRIVKDVVSLLKLEEIWNAY